MNRHTTTPHTTTPRVATKVARHHRIIEVLATNNVESQAQLGGFLADGGFEVTQATLSRDLDELGAVKLLGPNGQTSYAVPRDGGDPTPLVGQTQASNRMRLKRVVAELMSSVTSSANIVVLRTPPGAAQFLASTIDHSTVPDIIGTIAGDDTVLLVTRNARGGAAVARNFAAMGVRRSSPMTDF